MQRLLDTRLPEGWKGKLGILMNPARTRRDRNGRFREMMVSREVYERERKRPTSKENLAFVR